MFQTFSEKSDPSRGAERLRALRGVMQASGLKGWIVPRTDAHQGENVAACDERLAWLTGFTGSAGIGVVLSDRAAVFVDGRYRLQVRAQVDLGSFEPQDLPGTQPGEWIALLQSGGTIGYDPWLHTAQEVERLEKALGPAGIALRTNANLVDRIWKDRPAPPVGPVVVHPEELAGENAQRKRARLSEIVAATGLEACVLTLPDSICWLLNIRGSDIQRTPVAHCNAVLNADGTVDLFIDPAKLTPEVVGHLGNSVRLHGPENFQGHLAARQGKIGYDRDTAPQAVQLALRNPVAFTDPCILPKAHKNSTEIDGMRAAHLRDGAVMARFLHWLEAEAPHGELTEIAVVRKLEEFRRATGRLADIAFDTICGAGPNGAIVHYRVTEKSNRKVRLGDILLIDSGAQYRDGTTDITRTVAIGPADPAAIRAATLVLKGMIAISTTRWPPGLSGRDLDGFARRALWQAGLDYDHGTGHGVGAFLDVHERPQRLSRISEVPLDPGMVLSNEPGFYREGSFGIRIENLVTVTEPSVPDAGERPMLGYETLTLAPIDHALIDPALLDPGEKAWLNAYHALVLAEVGPLVPEDTAAWLATACRPV